MCMPRGIVSARRTRLTQRMLGRTGIGAAAVPLAAYATGEAMPPLASAGIAALVAGARCAAAAC